DEDAEVALVADPGVAFARSRHRIAADRTAAGVHISNADQRRLARLTGHEMAAVAKLLAVNSQPREGDAVDAVDGEEAVDGVAADRGHVRLRQGGWRLAGASARAIHGRDVQTAGRAVADRPLPGAAAGRDQHGFIARWRRVARGLDGLETAGRAGVVNQKISV